MAIFDIFRHKTGAVTHLVAGLGNPGPKYEGTHHNAGFMAIDYIAEKCGVKINRAKFDALTCEAEISGCKVLLMKPQTLMNLSGKAVSEAADFYKIPPENIIVLCDDVAIAPGKIRIKRKGSDGGQRGLRSITGLIGTEDFPRIKLGTGDRPNREYDLAEWVLAKFSPADKNALTSRFDDVYNSVELIISGECEKAMNLYN